MKTTFKITLTASSVLALIILLFPAQVFGIFTNETAVLRIAMEYRPVAFLVFFGSACRAPMNALINGSGNYKINFITAVLDGLVLRIGLAMLFGLVLHLEYVGFWLGDALAGYTPFFIGAVYFYTGRWKSGGHIIKRESA